MELKIRLPFEAVYILKKLNQAGYDSYLVGGAVRDILLNALNDNEHKQEITDFDFTTNAKPAEIQEIFSESYYTNEFGMVGIGYDHLLEEIQAKFSIKTQDNIKSIFNQQNTKTKKLINQTTVNKVHSSLKKELNHLQTKDRKILTPPPFEITTYRSDGEYCNHRKPESVCWGETVEDDLSRRDFTINAMALCLNQATLDLLWVDGEIQHNKYLLDSSQYKLVDLHQGLQDLTNQLIRTVGDADQRFREDALRMLRAIRFSTQLNMEIEPLALNSIKKQAHLIKAISWERIRDEFLRMLSSNQPDLAIKILDQTGLLEHIMPELLPTKNVEQGGHHTTDVWTHTLDAVANCPNPDPIVRLASLLHDIGKPGTYAIRNGEITFYNHEIVGSRIANKIGKRLKLSRKQSQKLFELVRYHMFYYQPDQTDAAVRRIIKRIGLKNIDDMLAVREADRLGSGSRKTSWRLEELKQRIIEQLNQPFTVTDLVIDGQDLMKALELKPGPIIGNILDQLMEKVLDNPEANTKEKLLKIAKEIVEEN
ncbi:MAG: HDIG domain-containing protein [Patescibacteria group bacterium]|nr:HDIG domain-containing protein [Patescibacteria group bacterium]